MTNQIWIPTKDECELIKRAASIESDPHLGISRLCLEPGIRHNVEFAEVDSNINIARVTKAQDGRWDDTDLEQTGSWADFRKGVWLTEDGRATVDFYIRARHNSAFEKYGCTLFGNVIVHYADGAVTQINCGSDHHHYLPHLLQESKE